MNMVLRFANIILADKQAVYWHQLDCLFITGRLSAVDVDTALGRQER